MSDPDNLVLEHLRAIRGDMSRMANRMESLSAEVTSIRLYLLGLVTTHEQDHGDLASIKARLDRVEKRLGLVD